MKPISSRDNPLVKRLHALSASSRERRKFGESLLDGAHLLDAALLRQWPLKGVVVAESSLASAEVRNLLARCPAEVPCYRLPDALFAHVSPVDTPSGLVAIIDLPPEPPPAVLSRCVVVLDAVQDPGNLGTILRTAAAAGVRDVLLTDGCAGAWSPRVLRAGMGAHFGLSIRERADVLQALQGFPGAVLATALAADARSLYDIDLERPVAWLFGAEGQGLSPALLARASERVVIPMAGDIESLNVAAAVAICLFEQARQRTR
ncbi:TrmH family RNA methyltransferase [Thauera linaloolentis]|uniref:tRNA/rRNA methyltransferase n=1 Tax=Thauera linaloolentis (strain DSM 12138 / JCM 21573 / CCUG 41526 / CIP 105981 / IAM 15112 / NBRC 102519 / 47Lol) TaxID=1123367 RepID=N6Y7Q2_THAL4|nr:RNA methyltransferase [Thauera linaloolentis]ENO90306.1 tRNA/rRNA methyltransferase [Thauera linaloolentis 47Lol = DSM 12138]MCM8566205.1 RNA methyltransferase [Thauera linaloolentis]